MENDIPYFETFDDFFNAVNMPPSRYEGLYLDVMDKLWTHPSLEVPPFKHNSYAIKLLLKGEGIMRIGKWKQNLKGPAIFISPPNQIVSCTMLHADFLEYSVIISDQFIEKYLKLKHFISVFEYFQAEKSTPIIISDEEMAELIKIFDYIYEEYQKEERIDSVEIMASAILTFFMKIRRLYNQYSLEEEQHNEGAVKKTESLSNRFLTLLHEDSQSSENTDYNIAYFASKLAVHPNYLSSKLKTETGRSAKKHLDAKLIHNAKTFLQQTDLSIKEIAFKLRFKESSHFVNFFKKHTAVTPAQYRSVS
ncbi:helix-turn-helix domain-containing protein [Chryseobacterium shigense]|uniref:AraC-like DNA-binding protein n=1 Tax=Chryseobacterium shigense TaxID=297244 RepID=A0A841NJL2_9FLAO|nr:response regulator transcription factor [Chryseobacterium shigense]MBB6370995.1 AraC-like DNA-binding protein [Chryseobacterium shigense]